MNSAVMAERLSGAGVITDQDRAWLQAEAYSMQHRNKYLLNRLITSGSCAKYYAFRAALDDTGQQHAADCLRATQQSLTITTATTLATGKQDSWVGHDVGKF